MQSTSTLQHKRSRLGWIGWLAPLALSAVALMLYLRTLSNVHTFDALSYSNKSWHTSQVAGAKTPKTRSRRIDKSIAALKEGRVR